MKTPLIQRFSSRQHRLGHVFLKDRLQGASEYKRIAGYFRSSIFELVHEELSSIETVRIVCNADLDREDVMIAGLSRQAVTRTLIEKWHEGESGVDLLLEQPRYRRLYELLTRGNVQIRVVCRQDAPFLHGKAGVIRRPDGQATSFMGSINETAQGWLHSYEMVWEDRSDEAIAWCETEFEWLWQQGIDLPEAVIEEIGREARRVEVALSASTEPVKLAQSLLVESPMNVRGECLQPWQKAFVGIFADHRERYGAARLLLADEVGVGKTLSMAVTGLLAALLEDGPLLILCPASLALQWQMELWDKLGVPSGVWGRAPYRGWRDHRGHLYRASRPQDILACPFQIGIVSTGIIVHGTREAECLLKGRYGTIVLDEGHKARVSRGMTVTEPEGNKLYGFMETLAERTRHLIIGTATPIQTDQEQIWDLLRLLAVGNDFVLGRRGVSRWYNAAESLALITGKQTITDSYEAWSWLRTPLPHPAEDALFDQMRMDLEIRDTRESFTDKTLSELDSFTRDELDAQLTDGATGSGLPFFRYHNPLARHVVLRRRKTLEDAGLMPRIAVNIHPGQDADRSLFEGKAIQTPHFYDQAYELVERFSTALAARIRSGGFIKSLLLQRICSSVEAGLSTARRMIEIRENLVRHVNQDPEQLGIDDPDLLALVEELQADPALQANLADEADVLQEIVHLLERNAGSDPKGRAILHFLMPDPQGGLDWAEKGCIVFSQYYDSVRWIASYVSAAFPRWPVAVYAGVGKSGIVLDGKWHTVDREEIKAGVKERKLKLVIATDAACEGLNLQTLGTLINADLPWNPSRLEQRIGRIKRFGQRRDSVDVANLVYQDTVDARVYECLSERMRDKYDILGSIPDTIEDDWINDIRELQRKLDEYTNPREQTDVFKLRYGDFLEQDNAAWERCEEVLARSEVEKALSQPWKMARGRQRPKGV
jgi:superfamily II DNA or RNA helicase